MDRYKILMEKDPPPFVFVKAEECGLCCINGPCNDKIGAKEPIIRGTVKWSGDLFCTREKGHKGPHVACSGFPGGHKLMTWE